MAKVNDVVLIYLEDSPVSFARVESILPDAKKDWYHLKLLMLQIPLQVVTWLLKGDYINGAEFHMNGKKMKLEEVKSPIEDLSAHALDPKTTKNNTDDNGSQKGDAEIISFSDLKKDHEPKS